MSQENNNLTLYYKRMGLQNFVIASRFITTFCHFTALILCWELKASNIDISLDSEGRRSGFRLSSVPHALLQSTDIYVFRCHATAD